MEQQWGQKKALLQRSKRPGEGPIWEHMILEIAWIKAIQDFKALHSTHNLCFGPGNGIAAKEVVVTKELSDLYNQIHPIFCPSVLFHLLQHPLCQMKETVIQDFKIFFFTFILLTDYVICFLYLTTIVFIFTELFLFPSGAIAPGCFFYCTVQYIVKTVYCVQCKRKIPLIIQHELVRKKHIISSCKIYLIFSHQSWDQDCQW